MTSTGGQEDENNIRRVRKIMDEESKKKRNGDGHEMDFRCHLKRHDTSRTDHSLFSGPSFGRETGREKRTRFSRSVKA